MNEIPKFNDVEGAAPDPDVIEMLERVKVRAAAAGDATLQGIDALEIAREGASVNDSSEEVNNVEVRQNAIKKVINADESRVIADYLGIDEDNLEYLGELLNSQITPREPVVETDLGDSIKFNYNSTGSAYIELTKPDGANSNHVWGAYGGSRRTNLRTGGVLYNSSGPSGTPTGVFGVAGLPAGVSGDIYLIEWMDETTTPNTVRTSFTINRDLLQIPLNDYSFEIAAGQEVSFGLNGRTIENNTDEEITIYLDGEEQTVAAGATATNNLYEEDARYLVVYEKDGTTTAVNFNPENQDTE